MITATGDAGNHNDTLAHHSIFIVPPPPNLTQSRSSLSLLASTAGARPRPQSSPSTLAARLCWTLATPCLHLQRSLPFPLAVWTRFGTRAEVAVEVGLAAVQVPQRC